MTIMGCYKLYEICLFPHPVLLRDQVQQPIHCSMSQNNLTEVFLWQDTFPTNLKADRRQGRRDLMLPKKWKLLEALQILFSIGSDSMHSSINFSNSGRNSHSFVWNRELNKYHTKNKSP